MFLKESNDGLCLMSSGKEFHSFGAHTENAQRPWDFRLNEGDLSRSLSADRRVVSIHFLNAILFITNRPRFTS